MKPYYQDDYVTIYHGDCRGILPGLPKADLVLTDPPYGPNEIKNNPSRGKLAVSKDYGLGEWDAAPVDDALLSKVRAMGSHLIIFGGNYFTLPPAKCWLVWDKDNGTNDFADCELAWTNLDMAVRKFLWRWNGMLQEPGSPKETRMHPTQKPTALMKWCLTLVPDASTVLDPFMGVGPVLVAGKTLNRKCIGIETEERYCEVAANRCRQMVMELGI